MNFRSEIEQAIKGALLSLDPESRFISDTSVHLEHPRDESHGDYSTNVAMVAFRRFAEAVESHVGEIIWSYDRKRMWKNPRGLAEDIQLKLQKSEDFKSVVAKIEVAGPGFINFWLKDDVLVEEVGNVVKAGGDYGRSDVGKGKTVLIDYSSPNIAKPFGIGHLRSTIIGQALYNLYAFSGWEVIGENYLGDWGTQFGKLIYAVLTWGDEKKLDKAERPIEELERLYVKFHREVGKDPQLEVEAREWFKRLEGGNKEAARLWKKFRSWSIKEFDRIYQLLGVEIDEVTGESQYSSQVPEVIKEAKLRSLAVESEGALVIPFNKKLGLPPLMLLKSDGATTYESRDLVAIKVRREKYHPDLFLYETGSEQTLRFKQLFSAAEMLGYDAVNQFIHVGHGLYRLPGGKLSTRRGRTVRLEEVLEEAVRRAQRIVEEKNSNLSSRERDRVSRAVGIGAVKYNDLSQHYSTNVVFDWEKMLSLEGNSAPYLQYTYARAKSVLKKSGGKSEDIKIRGYKEKELGGEESSILRYLYRFPEIIEEAVVANSPNLVCNFLFRFARRFNTFYARVPILKAEEEALRDLRLGLTAATAQVIKNGLTLLGIETLERL